MPLLPFDTFSFDTALPPREVCERLAAAIEPRKWLRFAGGRCPFEGEVQSDSFRIVRIITYRNSFLPHIHGRVIATEAGSSVEGTMSLHPLVLAFMLMWFGGVLLFCVGILGSMLVTGDWHPVALVPVGMFVFGWALTSGAFTFEARTASKLLRGIIAARDEPA